MAGLAAPMRQRLRLSGRSLHLRLHPLPLQFQRQLQRQQQQQLPVAPPPPPPLRSLTLLAGRGERETAGVAVAAPPPATRTASSFSSARFLPPSPSSGSGINPSQRPFSTYQRLSSLFFQSRRNLTTTRYLGASNTKPVTMVAEDYEAVLKGKYPAKAHAKRTAEIIREKLPDATGVLYLEATHTKITEDDDSPVHFRQRRYFYYLTGCNLPDCYFTYEIESGKSTLYIPPIEADEVIWSGLPLTKEDALAKYDVDEVLYSNEVNATLSKLASSNSTVFAIDGQIADDVKLSDFKDKDISSVKPAIEIARVVKDEYEVALIRKANSISAIAHKAVLEKARSATNERELYAVFLQECVSRGGPEMAYHPIMASGRAAATLHYVDNNAPLEGKMNLLIDAGCEYENYASDITRGFPLNGKFTKESRDIYDIVLKMQNETIEDIKGGVHWDDIHLHAHKVAIDGLLKLGILKGDKDEILKARTSAAFFPHGLGHYLGLDTHDKGGYPNPSDPDVLFRYLRLRRKLPVGSVVTVEPGVYFCEFIIRPYLKDPKHSKFIDEAVLDKYWDVGGVRIEDNILVTATGYENLTTAIKEANEVEAVMAA